jgi:hypothetical protein
MTELKSVLFLVLALVTIVLAYLYQRHERVQSVSKAWIWPLIFAILAARTILVRWPIDQQFALLLVAAFFAGIPIGIARGFAFRVRSGDKPGTMVLAPTVLSGTIYLAAILYTEFEHILHWNQPTLVRISCMLVVLTVGNSIAVNVTRVLRWKYQHL